MARWRRGVGEAAKATPRMAKKPPPTPGSHSNGNTVAQDHWEGVQTCAGQDVEDMAKGTQPGARVKRPWERIL